MKNVILFCVVVGTFLVVANAEILAFEDLNFLQILDQDLAYVGNYTCFKSNAPQETCIKTTAPPFQCLGGRCSDDLVVPTHVECKRRYKDGDQIMDCFAYFPTNNTQHYRFYVGCLQAYPNLFNSLIRVETCQLYFIPLVERAEELKGQIYFEDPLMIFFKVTANYYYDNE